MICYSPKKIILPRDILIAALQQEGYQIAVPRYPLLHQQPLFTEGAWNTIARLGPDANLSEYDPNALPNTQAVNEALIKLPVFPNADREILDQYIHAFEKVIAGAGEILKCHSTSNISGGNPL